MRKSTIRTTIALIICSLSATALASADTMTITYRSGKAQTVALDEPSAEVQGVSYLRTSGPPPEIKGQELSNKPADAEKGTLKDPSRESKKPGVSIKWAPPIDQ
jgi:hypothetical protein